MMYLKLHHYIPSSFFVLILVFVKPSSQQSNSWLSSRPTKFAPPESEIKSLEIALTPHLFQVGVLQWWSLKINI